MAGMISTNFDFSKLFLSNFRSQVGTYTNGGGSPVMLAKGTLLGRITSSQKVLPLVSTASDGSQQPLGILADDYTVAAGATIQVYFADSGDVAQEGLVFSNGTDTLATTVSSVSLRDLIQRNTHIKLVAATELSGYDN